MQPEFLIFYMFSRLKRGEVANFYKKVKSACRLDMIMRALQGIKKKICRSSLGISS
jgi:hypothetical protein